MQVLLRSMRSRWKIYDFCERDRVEARAAHQHAVDLGLRHERLGVVRFDASAVQNADTPGRVLAKAGAHLTANHGVCLSRHFGRGGLAGPDGPNGLISDHDFRELPGVEARDALGALLA